MIGVRHLPILYIPSSKGYFYPVPNLNTFSPRFLTWLLPSTTPTSNAHHHLSNISCPISHPFASTGFCPVTRIPSSPRILHIVDKPGQTIGSGAIFGRISTGSEKTWINLDSDHAASGKGQGNLSLLGGGISGIERCSLEKGSSGGKAG